MPGGYGPGRTGEDLDPDCLPWERQPTETEGAYSAFLQYRDAENRNVTALGGSERNMWLRWSAKWRWQYRALEWDRYIAREASAEMVKYRIEMDRRHRTAARLAQAKIAQWLQNLDVTKLRPADAARWFEVAVKVERLASGTGEQDAASPFDLEFPREGSYEFDRLMSDAGVDKREFANVITGLLRNGG